jgi:AraC family transcriptional regulator
MLDPVTGHVRADVVSESIVLASSSGLGWADFAAEVGHSRAFEPDGVVMAGHNLAMNVASCPLQVEVKGAHGFQRATLPPKSFWIQPGKVPFALRILGPARYGGVQISLSRARRLLGADMEVRPVFGLVDERLAAISRLILLETCAGGPSEQLYVEGLEIALLSRLRQLCLPQRPVGSLGAARLKLVNEYIEERLDEPLTTEDMASVAGVSPAHFAREFKRATGKTPHAFVVGRRIDRARQLLVGGGSIADTAVRCGFTDQAHLSRLFKRHLGVTPGAFVRRAGR